MISELITDLNRVGLPGLGTFVAEVVPATFSDKGYTINPPYRRLSFHPSRSEDTLLIDFYAASNGISKEAAGLYLKQFLGEMKSVLKERKTIMLPGLGRLRATVENNFSSCQIRIWIYILMDSRSSLCPSRLYPWRTRWRYRSSRKRRKRWR